MREAGIPRWQEQGEIEKKLQHFDIFSNRNGTKRREALRKGGGRGRSGVNGTGWGSRRYGKWEVQTLLYPPTQ